MEQNNCTISFKTDRGSNYIYDDKSGAVFPVNELLKKAIDLYSKNDIDTVRAKLIQEYPEIYVDGALKFIKRWRNSYGGFYRTPREKAAVYQKMKTFKVEDIISSTSKAPTSFRQILLNLTEDCNLRCKYCVYTDNYKYTRNPNKNKMKLETGKKALDYFFKLNEQHARRNPAKKLAVNFYGGEPLLCLSTMDKLIEYAKKNSPLPLVFYITTNGMLLKDKVVDFIVKNKMLVSISLDGTKENHDRNRVTVNGKGSFDIVYNNIKRFIERYPNYAVRLSIISVYDYNTNLEANAQFFEEENLPFLSFVDPVLHGGDEDTYYDRFTADQEEKFFKQAQRLLRRYISELLKGQNPRNYDRAYCFPGYMSILMHSKAYEKRPPMVPFTGTCLPGAKISVRADGTFDICERVNQTMPIGNVETGLDWNAIANVIKKYTDALGTKCLSCPITKMCSFCFGDGSSMKDAFFSITENKCATLQSDRAIYLALTYSMLERNPDAFQWVEEFMSRPEKRLMF